MSNIHAREEFRKLSMISGVSDGLIVGFGPDSYYLALKAITSKLQRIKFMTKNNKPQTKPGIKLLYHNSPKTHINQVN